MASRPARPWELQDENATVHGAARVPAFDSRAASRLIDAAAGKFTPDELRHLRAVAMAPEWADFDLVASAPRVDVLGGQYVLPFAADAFAPAMRSARYADTKALAYAGVSRAAYYVATGDRVRAEAALRSVVGFGFMMIDNGTSTLDALIGRAIADIGRDGLHQLYSISGDARGLRLTEPLPKQRRAPVWQPGGQARRPFGNQEVRDGLLTDVRDAALPAGVRYEMLQMLTFGTCGSVRGMLLGPSSTERAAFSMARADIARFPSEQQYVTLLEESMNRMPIDFVGTVRTVPERLAIGAATVVGTVLQNPRVASCTRVALVFH